jgi:CRP/FNR family transcriptional regulator, cyclic AMP receptor protein
MILLDMLEDLDFLQGLAPEHLRQVARIGQLREYPPGAFLFQEGKHAHEVFLVMRGEISLEVELPGRGAVPIQTVGRGELLGWSPVLGLGPMTATARTRTWCRLIALDVGRTRDLCRDEPRFGVEFFQRLAAALARRLHATHLQLVQSCSANRNAAP